MQSENVLSKESIMEEHEEFVLGRVINEGRLCYVASDKEHEGEYYKVSMGMCINNKNRLIWYLR